MYKATIHESAVLAVTGENRLEAVRQLIMRGMKLRSFDSTCAIRLQSLTVLSLSHNSLRDLESFQHLVNLVELNVNFNAITTLHSLACPNLQRLYLSNNLIASTQRLKTFPKLRTICLFKNILSDLACALEPLRELEDLRGLDLDGNPCAQSRGYKHRVIRSCSRLHELDGEEIVQLDRDLSALFFEEQQCKIGGTMDDQPFCALGRRPATAPAKSKTERNYKRGGGVATTAAADDEGEGRDEKGDDISVAMSTSEARVGLRHLPLGDARLLRVDRLNSDPQLLSYLAHDVLADPSGSPRDTIECLRRKACARLSSKGGDSSPRKQTTRHRVRGGEASVPGSTSTGLTLSQGQQLLQSTTFISDETSLGQNVSATSGGSCGTVSLVQACKDTPCAVFEDEQGGLAAVGSASNTPVSSLSGDRCTAVALEAFQEQQEGGAESSSRQGTTDADDSSCGFNFLSKDESVVTAAAEVDSSPQKIDIDGKDTTEGTCRAAKKTCTEEQALLKTAEGDGEQESGTLLATGAESTWNLKQQEQTTSLPPPPPSSVLPSSQTGVTDLDPSNPYATIRKLLKLVETFQLERIHRDEGCGQHVYPPQGHDVSRNPSTPYVVNDVDKCSEPITKEDLRRLRLENRNMHLLLVENRELKNQAREESARAEEKLRGLTAELNKVQGQLEEVAKELEVARAKLLHDTTISREITSKSAWTATSASSLAGGICSGATSVASEQGSAKTMSTVDLFVEELGSAAVDDELEELFRRNEQTMGDIRRELELVRQSTLSASPLPAAERQQPPSATTPAEANDDADTKEEADTGLNGGHNTAVMGLGWTPAEDTARRHKLRQGFVCLDGGGLQNIKGHSGRCGKDYGLLKTVSPPGSKAPSPEPRAVSELLVRLESVDSNETGGGDPNERKRRTGGGDDGDGLKNFDAACCGGNDAGGKRHNRATGGGPGGSRGGGGGGGGGGERGGKDNGGDVNVGNGPLSSPWVLHPENSCNNANDDALPSSRADRDERGETYQKVLGKAQANPDGPRGILRCRRKRRGNTDTIVSNGRAEEEAEEMEEDQEHEQEEDTFGRSVGGAISKEGGRVTLFASNARALLTS